MIRMKTDILIVVVDVIVVVCGLNLDLRVYIVRSNQLRRNKINYLPSEIVIS